MDGSNVQHGASEVVSSLEVTAAVERAAKGYKKIAPKALLDVTNTNGFFKPKLTPLEAVVENLARVSLMKQELDLILRETFGLDTAERASLERSVDNEVYTLIQDVKVKKNVLASAARSLNPV